MVPVPPSPLPGTLYAAIDGTGVPPDGEGDRRAAGEGEDGQPRAREVKLGVFVTQDKPGAGGYPVRGRASASVIAAFRWPLPRPRALHCLTRSLEFMLGDRRDAWLAARLEDLGYGDLNRIEAAVREYPLEGIKKDEAGQELGCFLNNAPRLRYRWFRSRGPFAGSGVAEGRCKTIAGQRLKQAGRHALDRRRSRRHHHPALQTGQQPAESHPRPPSQPDRSRLTFPCPKMITLEQDLIQRSGHWRWRAKGAGSR